MKLPCNFIEMAIHIGSNGMPNWLFRQTEFALPADMCDVSSPPLILT